MERVILLAVIIIAVSFSGLFLYIFAAGIVGLRRLRKRVTLNDIGVELELLTGGLIFIVCALQGVSLSQDTHLIALSAEIMQKLSAVTTMLVLSSAATAICGVIMLAVHH